jgi:hypothetical protein
MCHLRIVKLIGASFLACSGVTGAGGQFLASAQANEQGDLNERNFKRCHRICL